MISDLITQSHEVAHAIVCHLFEPGLHEKREDSSRFPNANVCGINACCWSIYNDQKALFSPQRKVHEDRDSEGIQHKKAGGVNDGDGEHRWAEFAVVVLEEPEIKVAIECSHGGNADNWINGK